jgi:hypothetical protein
VLYATGTHADEGQMGIGGVNVAVFNFRYIDLAANITVLALGDRPLVILSRTSIVWGCQLNVVPGTLGGWYGWGQTAGAAGTGVNERSGEGAGARAVYAHTLTVSGNDVDEIQTWTTTVEPEENLGGFYTIACKGETSRPIRYNAPPRLVERIIESDMPRLGEVQVSRTIMPDDGGGFTWNVTFVSAVSDVPQITVDGERLTGINGKIVTSTVRQANAVGGNFTLSFLGASTRPLAFDTSAEDVRAVLVADIPDVITAFVTRTDFTAAYNEKGEAPDSDISTVHDALCEDGGCVDGAGPAGGLVWTVLTSTRVGVVQPRTPTSPAALAPEWSEPVMLMTADASGLSGAGASAKVVAGHADTDTRIGSLSTGIVGGMLAGRANASLPFTLAFGGSGGSNGGRGGGSTAVYDQTNPEITRSFVGPVYNDERVSVLRGGSSGAVGGQLPLSRFLRHADMAGTAGSGGGVVEIVAHNDFSLMSTGSVTANGEAGEPGASGGGGGSGGTVVLVAGGALRQEGTVGATGGKGGDCVKPTWAAAEDASIPGSGGGGGRVAVYAESIYETKSSLYPVEGGRGGDCSVANGPSPRVGTPAGILELALSSDGDTGTDFVSSLSNISWYVSQHYGALGTQRSLVLVGGETAKSESGIIKLTPYLTGIQIEMQQPDGNYVSSGDIATNGYDEQWNGNGAGLGSTGDLCAAGATPPQGSGISSYCNQPRRVTVYLRFETTNEGSVRNAQGGQFAIHPAGGRAGYGGRGPIGKGEGASTQARQGGNILIGVAAVNGNLYHSANYDDIERMIKQKWENVTANASSANSSAVPVPVDPRRLRVLEAYEFKRCVYSVRIFWGHARCFAVVLMRVGGVMRFLIPIYVVSYIFD